MAPPLARAFSVDHLVAFDDDALEAFVVPLAVAPGAAERMGVALRGPGLDGLAGRIAARLDPGVAAALERARGGDGAGGPADVWTARRRLVDQLFWPLLYWHAPAIYDELIAGEDIHPAVFDQLGLDGRDVADLGCGSGRFTLAAARRARSVVAVDAAAPLLDRLCHRLARTCVDNVEVRRGPLVRLPLADASVDVAVACSSLGARQPFGGDAGLAEMRRVLRPGGIGAVIWPGEPDWFLERGLSLVSLSGPLVHRFRCQETARRLCRLFYSETAAEWVVRNRTADVPYWVLGIRPPADMCVLRV